MSTVYTNPRNPGLVGSQHGAGSIYSGADNYSYFGETSASPSLSRGESISNFLYDLNAAIAPKKIRLEAVAFALEFFNHSDIEAHDEELALGAANVLLSKLAYGYSVHPLDDEVYQIATSMNMILGGASRQAVSKAFDEAGKSVIPLMVDMVRPSSTSGAAPTCHPLAVNRMISILRYFSRVLTAMVPMAHYPGLLEALVYHVKRPLTSKFASNADLTDGEEFQSDVQRRIDALATLVNLACAEENKYLMAHHDTLLKEILTVANTDPVAQAREHAATIVMNLAYHEPNQSLLAHNTDVLDTLVVLMGDSHAPTRQYASAALFTLACVMQNTQAMASHRGGSILESLRVVLLEDVSDEARVNAAEALLYFARHGHALEATTMPPSVDTSIKQDDKEDTANMELKPSGSMTPSAVEIMSNHPGLLDALAQAVLSDDSPDVRNFAARALEWLAVSVHFPAEAHRSLLTALVEASSWTGTSSIAQAFYNQAQKSQNRLILVEHAGLLDALANLALLQALELQYVRGPAIRAIEQLSQEERARAPMAKHEGIMMALTKATFAEDEIDQNDDLLGDGTEHTANTSTTQLMRSALKNLTDAS